jgi:DNA-binding CsgD family transcriptional regulator
LNGALDVLSKPFAGHETLTSKERLALAQIIRGASSKEAGRTLGVSPRAADFHRANLLKKLGAKNAADLVHKILGGIVFRGRRPRPTKGKRFFDSRQCVHHPARAYI